MLDKLPTNINCRALAITCSIALAAIFTSSIPAAQAAYEYSPDSTMPEAGVRIALMDATMHGDAMPKLSDDLDIFKDTLKNCRTRVSSIVAAGEASGRLTVAEADKLRFHLDTLSSLDKELNKAVEPSYKHMLQLASHYDEVQNRINQLMQEYQLQMVPTDPAAVMVAGTTINLDPAMKRRALLENAISSDLARGQITGREAGRLREMLNVLAVKEGNLRKISGTLRAAERVQVDSGLKRISVAVNSSSM
jgi:hypothetical protein